MSLELQKLGNELNFSVELVWNIMSEDLVMTSSEMHEYIVEEKLI